MRARVELDQLPGRRNHALPLHQLVAVLERERDIGVVRRAWLRRILLPPELGLSHREVPLARGALPRAPRARPRAPRARARAAPPWRCAARRRRTRALAPRRAPPRRLSPT